MSGVVVVDDRPQRDGRSLSLCEPSDGGMASFRRPPRVSVSAWLRQSPGVLLGWGLAMAGSGCGLMILTWYRVAQETAVYRQLPFLVSGGLMGLVLVIVGATTLNIAARQRDAVEGDAQLDELIARLGLLAGLASAGRDGSVAVLQGAAPAEEERWARVNAHELDLRATRAFQATVAIIGLLLAGGLISIGLTWYGVATTSSVARQLPYIVSGGFLGFALLVMGVAMANAQFRSWTEASRRQRLERAVEVIDASVMKDSA